MHGSEQAKGRQRPQGRGEKAQSGEVDLGGASAWTKRSKASGEFMAVKRPAKKKNAATKFKGVRIEKKAARR